MNIQIPTPAVAVTAVSVQPTVAVVQPAVSVVQPTISLVQPAVVMSPMPVVAAVLDYLGYSIFTMLFCCLPLGIDATIYSCNTQEANLAGQRGLAISNSRMAFILNNVALGIGLTIIALGFIITFTVL